MKRKRMMAMAPATEKKPAALKAFDPATWAKQPRLLARNRADAAALLWFLAVLIFDVAWGGATLLLDGPVPPLVTIGAVLGGQVLLIVLAWGFTFARSLSGMTWEAQRATWMREVETGQDLDGDGEIGEPVGHVMRINGQDDTVLANLERPGRRVVRPLAGFPVEANDVLYVLQRATSRREGGDDMVGLGFRQWEGERLPGGMKIGREEWGKIQDGLLQWRFATKRPIGRGRRLVELREDVRIDDMMRAVRLSVREAQKREGRR